MTRFFTADLHFGHKKVSELRGFDIRGKHDFAIITAWDTTVKPDDEVFVLGDISGGRRDEEEYALGILGELPGIKHLIAGNHDSCASIHREGWKRVDRFREVFTSVRDFARIRANGTHALLSHYPYEVMKDGPGRGEARYGWARLVDNQEPLIHGHTHHTEPSMAEYPDMLCVSWDAWGRLATEHDVNEWLGSLSKEKVDSVG